QSSQPTFTFFIFASASYVISWSRRVDHSYRAASLVAFPLLSRREMIYGLGNETAEVGAEDDRGPSSQTRMASRIRNGSTAGNAPSSDRQSNPVSPAVLPRSWRCRFSSSASSLRRHALPHR